MTYYQAIGPTTRQCSKTQQFIGDFKIYCNNKNIAFEKADKTFMFGDLKSQDKVLNYLLIYMKYYIDKLDA